MINKEFSVSLRKIITKQRLEVLTCEDIIDSIEISNMDVNRPGLPLAGFFDYFDASRIQIFGKMESTYMEKFSPEQEYEKIDRIFAAGIPAIVITRSLQPSEQMLKASIERKVPILRSEESTSRFMSALIAMLSLELGERITRHGVLVEVYGEGILILGESGVGKSETAIELVKRGHRLIADDAVEIKKVSEISLIGSAPDIIKHFIELRGIGIVDVKNIFGMGAVKDSEKIDMVISLEQWQQHKKYDRLGLANETTEILGINLPLLTIPVRPGRNLAIIIEVAAMNNRQKKMGYNAAEELNKRLFEDMEKKQAQQNK